RHVAGLTIDRHLDRGAVELVEGRRPAERVVGLRLLARLADADDLAAQPAETAGEHVANGGLRLADPALALFDEHLALLDPFEARRHRPDLRLDVAARREDGIPH